MTAVFGMLVLATVPTGHSNWTDLLDIGICFFDFRFEPRPGKILTNYDFLDPGPRAFASVIQGLMLAWPLALLTLTYVRRAYDLLSDQNGIAWISSLRQHVRSKKFGSRLASVVIRWSRTTSPLTLPLSAITFSSVKFHRALVRLLESFFWHVSVFPSLSTLSS